MTRVSVGQGLATVWSALLGLVTAPYLIRNLGVSQYGVFALVALISSYLTNLEFGFGHATLRFLARARAGSNEEDESAVLGNSMLIYFPGALLAFGLTFWGASFIVHHFAHGPRALHGTFVAAIQLAAPLIAVSMLTSLASASLQGIGRFRLIISVSTIGGTALSTAAITIVALGGGLVDIIGAQLAVNASLMLTYGVALARATPGALRPRVDRRTLAAMAKFSVWLMVAGVASQIMVQGPPTVLAAYKTTAEVAAFAVPSAISQQLASLIGSASLGFLPFVSASSLDSDRSPVRAIYIANLRLTIIVLAPVVTFIAVFAHPLLATWINVPFAGRASNALRVMVGASLMLGLSSPPADLSRGFGKPALVTTYALLSALAIVGLSFVAVPSHGASGAAFGLAAGLSATTIPFIFVAGVRIVQLPPKELLRSLSGPLAALIVAAALYEAGMLLSDTFVSAVVSGALGTGLYGLLAAKVVLHDRERRVLSTLVRRTWRRSGEPQSPLPHGAGRDTSQQESD
jgi:O-antigen/teichoic acid export membrane protein